MAERECYITTGRGGESQEKTTSGLTHRPGKNLSSVSVRSWMERIAIEMFLSKANPGWKRKAKPFSRLTVNIAIAFLSPSRRDTPDYTESVPWPAARRRMPDQYPERAWSITNLIIINVGLSASVRSADPRATPWELQNGAPSEFGRAFLFPYFFGVFLHGFVCLFIATKSVVFCFFSRVNRW